MGLVSKISCLTYLSPQAEKWLNENIQSYKFSKNEVVLREGMICNALYYVNSGMLSSYYFADDREVCNWIAIENDFATSYYSFILRTPSYECIEALEDCEIQTISFEKLNEMYKQFPEAERAGRLILEEYYSRLEERLISIRFKPAKQRYDALFKQRPEIIKRAPLGKIASYLGMTQETLSRIRAEV